MNGAQMNGAQMNGAQMNGAQMNGAQNGTQSPHADHRIVGARAVVVPAVNGHRHVHFIDPNALQFQIMHNQAGRQSVRVNPRLNDQRFVHRV